MSRFFQTSATSSSGRNDYIAAVVDGPTLYEWAGGHDAFDRMIDAFYDRVERDEMLSPLFPGGVHEEHRRNVAAWWVGAYDDAITADRYSPSRSRSGIARVIST
jgi:hypothetical protein